MTKSSRNTLTINSDSSLWYDYGARFYDSQIGRWTTVDPLAENVFYVVWSKKDKNAGVFFLLFFFSAIYNPFYYNRIIKNGWN